MIFSKGIRNPYVDKKPEKTNPHKFKWQSD